MARALPRDRRVATHGELGWFPALRVLLAKELLAEWRARDAILAMLLFALSSLLIFNFALDLAPVAAEDIVPGILWVTLVFAAILGLERSFQREQAQGGLEGLMLAPLPRGAIYLAKMVGNTLLLLLLEAIALPILVALWGEPLPLALAPVLLLGTLGISAAGTTFAAMSANTRLRAVLLPLLLLPILVPMLIGAVQATGAVMHGEPLLEAGRSALGLMVAFDILFVTGSLLLFDAILEQ